MKWWLTVLTLLTVFWVAMALICIAFTGETYVMFSWYYWIAVVVSGLLAVALADKILASSKK